MARSKTSMEAAKRSTPATAAIMAAIMAAFILAAWAPAAFAESGQLKNDAGLVLYYKGQYPQALKEFLAAREAEPNNAEIHYNLGRTYYKMKANREALESLRKALELKPNYNVVKTILKKVESEMAKKDTSSIQTFSRNFKVQVPSELNYPYPDFTDGFYAYYSGDQQGSIDKFERDSKKPEKSSQVLMDQAIIYYHLRYFDDAVKYFQKAADADAKNAAAWYDMGLSYEQLGNSEKAIEAYQKATKINTKFPEAAERLYMVKDNILMNYVNEGNSYFNKNDWAKAIEVYEKALELALPHSQEYQKVESNLKVAKIEISKIRERKDEINMGFLNRNVEFGEANANRGRYNGAIVTWKGIIYAIEKYRDSTDFIMCNETGVHAAGDRGIRQKVGRDNFVYPKDHIFLIRFTKSLPQSDLLTEFAEITVVGKITGVEQLKNALKYKDYSDKIVISPLKITARKLKNLEETKDLGRKDIDQRDIDTYDAGVLVLEFNR